VAGLDDEPDAPPEPPDDPDAPPEEPEAAPELPASLDLSPAVELPEPFSDFVSTAPPQAIAASAQKAVKKNRRLWLRLIMFAPSGALTPNMLSRHASTRSLKSRSWVGGHANPTPKMRHFSET
jgi:hypothetical protein